MNFKRWLSDAWVFDIIFQRWEHVSLHTISQISFSLPQKHYIILISSGLMVMIMTSLLEFPVNENVLPILAMDLERRPRGR